MKKEVIGRFEKERIEKTLKKRYGHYLRNEEFHVWVFGESDSVHLRMYLDSVDGMSRYSVEILVPLKANNFTLREAIDLSLDFLGYYLDQFFEENRELLLPLDYQRYQLGSSHVYAKGDFTRPKLDQLADQILMEGEKIDPDDPRFKDLK